MRFKREVEYYSRGQNKDLHCGKQSAPIRQCVGILEITCNDLYFADRWRLLFIVSLIYSTMNCMRTNLILQFGREVRKIAWIHCSLAALGSMSAQKRSKSEIMDLIETCPAHNCAYKAYLEVCVCLMNRNVQC